MEVFSENEKQSLLSELKNNITLIENDIKNKDYKGAAVELLVAKKNYIQELYNKYVVSKVVTESDYNDAYNAMKVQSKSELYLMQLKAKRNLLLMISVGIIIVGIVVYKIKTK